MSHKRLVPISFLLFLIAVIAGTALSEYAYNAFVPMMIGGSSNPTPAPTWKNLGMVGEPISDMSTSQGAIYVGTYGYKHGVFRSENLGKAWEPVNNGLTNFDIFQIEAAVENRDILYSVTEEGFWRSTDGGNTWFEMNPTTDTCFFVHDASIVGLLSDSGSSILVMCSDNYAISNDGGDEWALENIYDDSLINCSFRANLRPAPSNRRIVIFFTSASLR